MSHFRSPNADDGDWQDAGQPRPHRGRFQPPSSIPIRPPAVPYRPVDAIWPHPDLSDVVDRSLQEYQYQTHHQQHPNGHPPLLPLPHPYHSAPDEFQDESQPYISPQHRWGSGSQPLGVPNRPYIPADGRPQAHLHRAGDVNQQVSRPEHGFSSAFFPRQTESRNDQESASASPSAPPTLDGRDPMTSARIGGQVNVVRSTLHSDFKKRKFPKKYFVVGRVFQTPWSERADAERRNSRSYGDNQTSATSQAWTLDSFGELMYTTTRRFVVVKEGEQWFTAIPITTYRGQGLDKPNIRLWEHGVIYIGKTAPATDDIRRHAAGIQPLHIRVDSDLPEEKLDNMSRIDYGKPQTMHHYIKVRGLGKVNRSSMLDLVSQFQTANRPTTEKRHDSVQFTIVPQLELLDMMAFQHHQLASKAISDLVVMGWSQADAARVVQASPKVEPDGSEALEAADASDGTR